MQEQDRRLGAVERGADPGVALALVGDAGDGQRAAAQRQHHCVVLEDADPRVAERARHRVPLVVPVVVAEHGDGRRLEDREAARDRPRVHASAAGHVRVDVVAGQRDEVDRARVDRPHQALDPPRPHQRPAGVQVRDHRDPQPVQIRRPARQDEVVLREPHAREYGRRDMRDVLYERVGDAFHPSAYTRGPWSPDHQHAGPPSALLLRALEQQSALEHGQTVRAAFDILRPVPIAPLTIATSVLRPGRNVEQVEARLSADGVEVMRARAWRMRLAAVELPDGLSDISPGPAPPEDAPELPRANFFSDDIGYVDGLEWRFVRGSWNEPGPAVCWTRMRVDLVDGEPIRPLEHLLVMGDAASGVSAALDWSKWNFLNVDLSVALERPPEGEWMSMDAETRFAGAGAATAQAVYADRTGRVGSSSQALLIAPK